MKAPTSLQFVKLKDYQKFTLISKPTNEDLIKCILDISKADLSSMKLMTVDTLTNELNDLFDQKHEFINEFTLYGTTYGFIPKLDEITYGENKDITSYINDWDKMHKAMAVMFRPITKKYGNKYLIEEYEGSGLYSEIMKDAPLNVVLGAMVFFYNLTNELLNSIPKYLEKQLKDQQMTKAALVTNGEAIANCTVYLKETLQSLKKLQSYHYINV
tara:strand:+ start:1191 stop:1835 length:645 start_codon:yes stop_codon:yes gene_type:complete